MYEKEEKHPGEIKPDPEYDYNPGRNEVSGDRFMNQETSTNIKYNSKAVRPLTAIMPKMMPPVKNSSCCQALNGSGLTLCS